VKITDISMTVRVNVDGEATHPAQFGRQEKPFRPVEVEVRFYESMEKDSIEFSVNVVGYFQTKHGADFQERASISYSQKDVEWERLTERQKTFWSPAPDYVGAAVDLAAVRYQRAVIS
jgi:tRNA(Ser,Leu) C12 N-acetylase TAN1